MLPSQISKNQSGKEYNIQGQLSIFLHKISLRSVENYFTYDLVIISFRFRYRHSFQQWGWSILKSALLNRDA